MTPQIAALMADYNRQMNERIFNAAATLDPATLQADQGAFFGSILGTLNHLAVGDTIWLSRFARHPSGFASLRTLRDLAPPTSLTQPLAADLPELRRIRQHLNTLIEQWTAELSPEHLATPLDYSNLAGVRFTRPFGPLVQHFFNHQTHHRGQVSTLLFQCGVDIGVTDLLASIPPSPT